MSIQEAKDERKETEGDPQVRARRRRAHTALVRQKQLQDVRTASVVVVNPDHYAVALRYLHALDAAPLVLAKGVDDFALAIKDAAFAAGVPIRENPALAQTPYTSCRVGKPIPESLYQAVAVIIAWANRSPTRLGTMTISQTTRT